MNRTHAVMPDGEGLPFLILRSGLPYIITVPSQSKFMVFGVYQQIE